MVEGEAACLGFVSYLKKPVAAKNSFIVDMLLEAGAVLYVKTNVPQTLFVSHTFYQLQYPEACRGHPLVYLLRY
jgi:amidase